MRTAHLMYRARRRPLLICALTSVLVACGEEGIDGGKGIDGASGLSAMLACEHDATAERPHGAARADARSSAPHARIIVCVVLYGVRRMWREPAAH